MGFFFTRQVRCYGGAARSLERPSSLHLCLSFCLLQSAPDPLCGPILSPLCIHMYLAPDTMDSEMAPLVDGDDALDRKTEDDSGNGRRSERRKEGE